ncbi:hypothetical protein K9K77_00885 [Candidatus Babeliales bacterium]|nr:hypothetical protein [Candidatus Babeliales bacterium]
MKKNILVIGMLLSAAFPLGAVWQPLDSKVIETRDNERGCMVFPTMEYSWAYNAHDNNKNQQGLDKLLFGQVITLGNLFLPSKLANEGKLKSTAGGAADNYYQDAYLGTLANTELNIDAEQQQYRFAVNGAWTFNKELEGQHVLWTCGFHLPIEYYEHTMNMTLSKIDIGTSARYTGEVTSDSVGGHPEFLQRYADAWDFFSDEVLLARGLLLDQHQRSFGIGSVKLYSMLDWKNFANYKSIDAVQLAFVLGLPSSTNPDGNTIWQIERGSSNTVQMGAQAHLAFNMGECCNAYFTVSAMGHAASNVKQRVPKKMTGAIAERLNEDVEIAFFGHGTTGTKLGSALYLSAAIDEYDTVIPFFAQSNILTRRHLGAKINATFGVKADAGPFVFDAWYTLYYKQKDSAKVHPDAPAGTYNIDLTTERTNETRNTFGWSSTYGLQEGATLSIGTQHVFKAQNSPQYHTVFITFGSTF